MGLLKKLKSAVKSVAKVGGKVLSSAKTVLGSQITQAVAGLIPGGSVVASIATAALSGGKSRTVQAVQTTPIVQAVGSPGMPVSGPASTVRPVSERLSIPGQSEKFEAMKKNDMAVTSNSSFGESYKSTTKKMMRKE
jgi:hypothetical protein